MYMNLGLIPRGDMIPYQGVSMEMRRLTLWHPELMQNNLTERQVSPLRLGRFWEGRAKGSETRDKSWLY